MRQISLCDQHSRLHRELNRNVRELNRNVRELNRNVRELNRNVRECGGEQSVIIIFNVWYSSQSPIVLICYIDRLPRNSLFFSENIFEFHTLLSLLFSLSSISWKFMFELVINKNTTLSRRAGSGGYARARTRSAFGIEEEYCVLSRKCQGSRLKSSNLDFHSVARGCTRVI